MGWPPPTAFLEEAAFDCMPCISFEDVDLIEIGGTCYFY